MNRHLVLAAAGFTTFLNLYAPQTFLPDMARRWGCSPAEAGFTVSISTLVLALSAPFWGRLAGRITLQTLGRIGALGLVGATVAAALSPDYHAFVASRAMLGLFIPAIYCVAITYMQYAWPAERQASAMAEYVAWNIGGGFAGRLVGGVVADLGSVWWAFVALAVWTAVSARPFIQGLPVVRAAAPVSDRGVYRIWRPYVSGFCSLFSLVAVFTYAPFYLAGEPFHLSPATQSALYTVFLAGVITTPLCGRIVAGLGTASTMWATVTAALFGVACLALPHIAAIAVGLTLLACAVFMAQATTSAYIGQRTGRSRSAALGLYSGAYYLGGSLGAWLPGLLFEALGWPSVLILVAAAQMAVLKLMGRTH